MLYMDRDAKVSTATSSPDLSLRVQRSRQAKFETISNIKNNSQPVGHGQTCKSVQVNLFVRPIVKRSKVKEGQNFDFKWQKCSSTIIHSAILLKHVTRVNVSES